MTDLKARAMLEMSQPRYKSKTEAAWAQLGALIIRDEMHLDVAIELYEALSFHLPGGLYTPDFNYIMMHGTITLVEVKGSPNQKGYRDSRSKLRAAAEVYPWFHWYMATKIPAKDGGGWKVERMNADPG